MNIILLIGGSVYLAMGIFILVILAKNSITLRDIGIFRALAILFLWLPIWILGCIE